MGEEQMATDSLADPFHYDILVEILSKLPPQSLLRSACVCKTWKEVIRNDPDARTSLPQLMSGLFHRAYVGGSFRFTSTLDHEGNINSCIDLKFSFMPSARDLHLYDCCNGLLLCSVIENDDWEDTEVLKDALYVACNPATKDFFFLPPISGLSFLQGIAYEPKSSPHFQVVRVLFQEDDVFSGVVQGIRIFSSETGEWKRLSFPMGERLLLKNHPPVYFNGTLHVMANLDRLLCFDLTRESLRLERIPFANHSSLGACNGSLLYVAQSGETVQVWEKESSSEQWVLKHTTMVDWNISILAVHPDVEVLFARMGNTILVHRLGGQEWEKWRSREEYAAHKGFDVVFPYSPCFTKLKQNVKD